MNYYPVLLDLNQRPVAIVGGGKVALEKVEGLLEAGALLTVYSSEPIVELVVLEAEDKIRIHREEPTADELSRATLILAERRGREANDEVFAAAEAAGKFVNVQDDVPCCSFIAPSIVRQGDLVVSISTSGAAPALAVRLRQFITRQLGPEYGKFLSLARRFRRPLAENVSSFSERRRRWYELVDSRVWQNLRTGDDNGAEIIASEILGVIPDVQT